MNCDGLETDYTNGGQRVKHLFLLCGVVLCAGCSSAGYYWQAVNGHARILNREKPIAEVIADKSTRPAVRQKLQQVQAIRRFASQSLHLPDNNSYTQYVDLKRPYALWNVVATPRFSIQPKQWCYLFVGCMSYRGYYDKQQAETYASSLRQQGYDVMVSGARAYSTLGWLEDPLLNTMLYRDNAKLAGIIFHELAHQRVYKKGFSAFNEAFAMTVEFEGVIKWLSTKNDVAGIKNYKEDFKHQLQFNQLLRATRKKLQQAYSEKGSQQQKAKLKRRLFIELKANYQKLKQDWGGDTGYDAWMAQDLNNAHLALVGTYYDDVPYFQSLLKEYDYDFARFYKAVAAMRGEQIKVLRETLPRLVSRQ